MERLAGPGGARQASTSAKLPSVRHLRLSPSGLLSVVRADRRPLRNPHTDYRADSVCCQMSKAPDGRGMQVTGGSRRDDSEAENSELPDISWFSRNRA